MCATCVWLSAVPVSRYGCACAPVPAAHAAGIFAAAALAARGLRVAVVERGPLRGRAQEWNISRKVRSLVHQYMHTQTPFPCSPEQTRRPEDHRGIRPVPQ